MDKLRQMGSKGERAESMEIICAKRREKPQPCDMPPTHYGPRGRRRRRHYSDDFSRLTLLTYRGSVGGRNC